ncbi:protein transport protein Sec31A isoform X2 [Neocloeon triangulifer]|uniref:protein transport protein Sec31A isoform X2 n=1 Tax=Neocloeon triangulifer TaxID=2078957 RepID=UPI00286F847F|nr:protein transport protein Sec31A isoform X2 [Neocloeon triangulifer]
MRVKEVERTVNVAWSPPDQHPILLAGGTAAQQLDATFSTTAALELFALNLSEPGTDMERVGGTTTEQRFHKLFWSRDLLIGGCDSGIIELYSPQGLLSGQNALKARKDGHSGAVKALDVNPFQQNLLASGAGDSEIFIWDLDQMSSPMTPGAKVVPPDAVSWLSWNRQVQHILASTFASRCVVWDLRKNEPIIKLADSTSHVRWNVVAWHPDVATQLCLSSEDDMAPVVQLWDLRFATSPLKTMAGHTRAVTCISWCAKDPDLLLSCGRDNKILCWNPNEPTPGNELICEIQTPHQWLFDVAWCPRNPSLISCSSFDGHVSIYSLTGGQQSTEPTTSKIADSFPGMESIAPAIVAQPVAHAHVDLRKAPKWLRKPAGSTFSFGGRLVQFSTAEPNKIIISQLVSEPELLNRASKLDDVLNQGQYREFCLEQSQSPSSPHLGTLWKYLGAQFEPHPQSATLALLGYPLEQVNGIIDATIGDDVNNLANDISQLTANGDLQTEGYDQNHSFGDFPTEKFSIPNSQDPEGQIGQALLIGRVEAAVELCLKQNRMADALLLAMTGGPKLLAQTQQRYFKQSKGWLSHLINAVVSHNWQTIISTCSLSSWAQLLAGIITHTNGEEFFSLCQQLGERLENDAELKVFAQVCYLCSGNVNKLVSTWETSFTPSSNLQLQEMVQGALLLQLAASTSAGRAIPTTGALANFLSKYAFLLASQGALTSALSCLESAQDESALELKDRLQTGLGMKSQPRAVHQQQQQQQIFRRTSGPQLPTAPWPRSRTVSQSSGYEPTVPTYPQTGSAGYQPSPSIFQPAPAAHHTPAAYPPAPSPAPTSYQTPFQPAPVPAAAAPPPPPTGGKPAGLSAVSGRKYVADPSVQSGSPYGQSYGNNQFGQSSPYSSNSYTPSPYVDNTTYQAPQQPSVFSPSSNAAYNTAPGTGSFNSSPYATYNEPQGVVNTPPRAPPKLMESQLAPPGWNDPPPVSKSNQKKPDINVLAPITHPLFGVAPAEPEPVNMGYQGGYYQPTMPQQQPIQNQQYVQPAAPMQQAPIERATICEPPKPKAEIPAEHIVIANVLTSLKDQCVHVAANPQMRRKLEDVGRKLEIFFDCLREHKLSENLLASFHELIRYIQAGDYQNGLHLHTQLISGPDFSQISTFMPSIKVLIQTSAQLGIYVQ